MINSRKFDSVIELREELMLSQFTSALSSSQDLGRSEIKEFISNFLNTITDKKLEYDYGYSDVDSMLQRIKSINGLDDVINSKAMLSMTLYVLPYLEQFYQSSKYRNSFAPVIKKDILHMFTYLVMQQDNEKIRIKHNQDPMSKNLDENTRDFYISVAKIINLQSNKKSLSENEYSKYLDKISYESTLLHEDDEDEDENEDLRAKKFSLVQETSFLFHKNSDNQYVFIHEEFLDYFATLLRQSINGRLSEIKKFMNSFNLETRSPKPSLDVNAESMQNITRKI